MMLYFLKHFTFLNIHLNLSSLMLIGYGIKNCCLHEAPGLEGGMTSVEVILRDLRMTSDASELLTQKVINAKIEKNAINLM